MNEKLGYLDWMLIVAFVLCTLCVVIILAPIWIVYAVIRTTTVAAVEYATELRLKKGARRFFSELMETVKGGNP